jgi:hypothetical protein
VIRSTRAWLGLACLVCLATRAPTLRYGVISDDEAIYDAMSRSVAAGGTMYRDTVDHKPPGLVYTYAAARSLVGERAMDGVHLYGILAAILTCLALSGIARKILDERAAVWPPLLYALVTATKQPVDALAVNGELLMNLPSALAVWAVLAAATEKSARRVLFDVAAGALVTVAALYKYQAAVVGLAFPLLLVGERAPKMIARGLSWALGAMVPLALVLLFFRSRGALDDAIGWGLGFNRHYLAEGAGLAWAMKRLGQQLAGVVLPGALIYYAGLLGLTQLLRRRAIGVESARPFLVGWTLLAIACVGLGGRFFGHYFLQLELPLSLLAAAGLARLYARRRAVAIALLALPTLAFTLVAASPARASRIFEEHDYSAIGDAIRARTSPSDTIWVWGNAPQIYFSSQRTPGVRFTFCNYLTGLSPATPSEYDPKSDPRAAAVPGGWKMVIDDLDRRRPSLIADTAAADLKSYGKFPVAAYPTFAAYLAAHYRRDGEVQGVVLYRRID